MREQSLEKTAVNGITNVFVVLSILKQLGGAERYVDIEEIALAAFKIAPDRFGWRTQNLPSWERVRTAFVHANQNEQRRGKPPLVHSNTDGSAWRLTAEGVGLVIENSRKANAIQELGPPPKKSGKSAERVRRIQRHPAYIAFSRGTPVRDLPRHELADLLLCPPDSPSDAVFRKVNAAKAAAVDVGNNEVIEFLSELENQIEEKWS